MTLHENVQRGAAWLDTVRPGWERDIDPATLDLENSRRCVLGQVGKAVAAEHAIVLPVSGFLAIVDDTGHEGCLATLADAVERTDGGFGDDWAINYGFEIGDDSFGKYLDLDDLWIAEIKDRVNR